MKRVTNTLPTGLAVLVCLHLAVATARADGTDVSLLNQATITFDSGPLYSPPESLCVSNSSGFWSGNLAGSGTITADLGGTLSTGSLSLLASNGISVFVGAGSVLTNSGVLVLNGGGLLDGGTLNILPYSGLGIGTASLLAGGLTYQTTGALQVPEPGTSMLLSLGLALILCGRRLRASQTH